MNIAVCKKIQLNITIKKEKENGVLMFAGRIGHKTVSEVPGVSIFSQTQ